MRPLATLSAFVLALAVAVACRGGEGDAGSNADPTNGIYLALGDSLSEGVGASDRRSTAFVPLVHSGLGEGWELVNLGESGDTSGQLIGHGHLDQAIARIERGRADDDPTNDVNLVTLEIGGNDLLNLFFDLVLPGICPSLAESLERPACVGALQDALDGFRPNLQETLDRLLAADPDLPLVVMTLYSPFSGETGLAGVPTISDMAELALEGLPDTPFPIGLNDIIREEVAARDLPLVDWWPLFQGMAGTYIADDFIHPNDAGYRVLADAVLEVVAD
jgi:lysophospholipase L1-like esterase